MVDQCGYLLLKQEGECNKPHMCLMQGSLPFADVVIPLEVDLDMVGSFNFFILLALTEHRTSYCQ